MADNIVWTFYGYVTPAGGRDVQVWFDGLDEDAQDEIRDALVYLEKLPPARWRSPLVEPLGQGLSEIRVKANVLQQIYRLYGFYWPQKRRYVYTVLSGTSKKVSNPQDDIKEARRRQSRVERGEADIYELDLSP